MLSIVTITYNNIVGLRETANSILEQHSKEIEWIVVDGNSSDGTEEFLKNCEFLSTYISEPDRGIYDAMQKGLKMAKGDYVLLLNAGDTFSDNDAVNYINAHLSNSDVYFYSCRMSGLGKDYVRKSRPLSGATYSVPAVQQATVYKRVVLLNLEWPIAYKICGDFSIAAQLLMRGAKAVCDDRVVAQFALGGLSTMRPMELSIEAYRIQSQILKLPFLIKVIYFSRRLLTGYFVLLSYRLKTLSI